MPYEKKFNRRLHRTLDILNKLQAGRTVTTLALATEYAVNQRSILRDLEALGMAGFPIQMMGGGRAGYSYKMMDTKRGK